MVKQVRQVVRKIESLPPADQSVLAKYLASHFEEVLAEARWDRLLAASSPALERMGAQVDQAIASGDVRELDPDEL